MNSAIETLFTSAIGLHAPWEVTEVNLNTMKQRIDFEVSCQTRQLDCPA
jgi:transposase